jgi:hypothetical protein
MSCKKLVSIDQPISSITSEGVFNSDETANSAVTGIYSKLINTYTDGVMIGSGSVTIHTGLASDELAQAGVGAGAGSQTLQFYTNELLSNNIILHFQLWGSGYFSIFQINSCIEGLQNSKNLTPGIKNQLTGECKFLRAFINFYLTNMWGDVPLPLTADWNKTNLLFRSSKEDVYKQIVSDLLEAKNLLNSSYSLSGNQKIRADKYAASALLARVYLYNQEWANAENEASLVINSGLYSLNTNLNDVFLKNSTEAILQFQPSNAVLPFAVIEQFFITRQPEFYYLTNNLANAFEFSDRRKTDWTDTVLLSGTPVLYPYKYKIRQGTTGSLPEYYMVLRLAEQYLIRSEARAKQNKVTESSGDLNIVRNRAGLNPVTITDVQTLLLAIEKERRLELFAEWGHRWFDLIRTGRANTILSNIKGNTWQVTDQLYPIPISEIKKNPNLTQNPGYN